MKSSSLHPSYRPDIDGLRAIAVLAVIGFHAFPGWIGGGFAGVDIFFVISGFLISSILFGNLENGTFRFPEFYARRIKRIFPALIAVLVACLAFGWFALLGDEYKQLGKHTAAAAAFAANFTFWNEAGYFDNAAATKPLLHLWSLGVEEQFYILWPLLAWLAWKKRLGFLVLVVTILFLSFGANLFLAKNYAVADFFSPFTRFWELMAGGLLAHGARHKPLMSRKFARFARPDVMAIAGMILIIAALFWFHKGDLYPGKRALLPVVGTCLLIAAGSNCFLNKRILSFKPLVGTGLISYPLYLWHWPLLSFARIIESTEPSPALRVALIVASFPLAWLTYRFVEKPIRFGARRRWKVPALCVLMALAGIAGLIVYKAEGFGQRAAIVSLQNNRNELIRTPAIDDACKTYIGRNKFAFDYCRYNKAGGEETVAVIGDSHAHVVYPGLAELLAAQGKNAVLLANSGCPTLRGALTGKNERERGECHDKIEQILDILTHKKNIDAVVIAVRGPVYISGNGYGEAEKESRNEFIRPDPAFSDRMTPADLYLFSLQNTVDALRSANKKVYVLIEYPETGIDPGACVARPFRPAPAICLVKKADVLERQKQYRSLLGGLHDAVLIDPMPAFCPRETCPLMRNGALLYADSNHLSVAGSRFLAQNVLSAFLGSSPASHP